MSAGGQTRPIDTPRAVAACPLCSNCYRIDCSPRTDAKCHVWTAPSWQGFSSRLRAGRCSHVFGLLARFVVCACGEEQTWNIIAHKYLVGPDGQIGRDNFYGWNREEREDFNRLMVAREFKPGEEERLRQIQAKGGFAMYPPRESLYPLVFANREVEIGRASCRERV